MKSSEVRQKFFDFFEHKGHKIVPSAPMVVKNDPTLMFTNAGMNQFKDYFLGNSVPANLRVADSQKCLRVSGKHNDLEEVGYDSYHHTMFEMLGNWSFGDYFKKEAIGWSWKLLTDVYKIDKEKIYVTYFGGDTEEMLPVDDEAYVYWEEIISDDRIIAGNKKDNFWEMGETGPCGPCSEIHVDLRPDEERKKVNGSSLVNTGHPEVIEIWNLVFIQFNRLSDGSLQQLPSRHVDTGMGFERLCRVLSNVKSNYDTDIFQPIIHKISEITGIKYGSDVKTDIAIRVIADHVRAIAFSIADGQLPSNNKAGYVIRRILRRAVRYGYTYLKMDQPFIYKITPVLSETMGDVFPEIKSQQSLIEKVIAEEEASFLKTLETGIKLLSQVMDKAKSKNKKEISGKTAFELYDTYGFPLDLTELILKENDLVVNKEQFDQEMKIQKDRSRSSAATENEDWVVLIPENIQQYVGYDKTETEIKIAQYRQIKIKDKIFFQLVFDQTPFYGESGGQVGDTGYLQFKNEKISIFDTKKENDLIVHLADKLPANNSAVFKAVVNNENRSNIAGNHSATHLLHYALRKILGTHVEQKGSLVHPEYLRFDFSHFHKISEEELIAIELLVNQLIRHNLNLEENRDMSYQQAQKNGAIALFGEKYGDQVRVIKFGDSVELCGGTHISSTGKIGLFKIVSESAIAAGIRRIEAITGEKAINYIQTQAALINQVNSLLNVNSSMTLKTIDGIINENKQLKKDLGIVDKKNLIELRDHLITKAIDFQGQIKLIIEKIEIGSSESGKDLAFELNRNIENVIVLLGAVIGEKANLWLMISENLVKEKNLNAVEIIKEAAKEIQGGGGGQAFFATAGGKNIEKIQSALDCGKKIIISKIS